jgi:hypothetical protein
VVPHWPSKHDCAICRQTSTHFRGACACSSLRLIHAMLARAQRQNKRATGSARPSMQPQNPTYAPRVDLVQNDTSSSVVCASSRVLRDACAARHLWEVLYSPVVVKWTEGETSSAPIPPVISRAISEGPCVISLNHAYPQDTSIYICQPATSCDSRDRRGAVSRDEVTTKCPGKPFLHVDQEQLELAQPQYVDWHIWI